jgi:hypothetical protein
VANIFLPTQPDDPMVERLAALRDEAEACGHELLTHLIELALVEAEKIAEIGSESVRHQPGQRGTP